MPEYSAIDIAIGNRALRDHIILKTSPTGHEDRIFGDDNGLTMGEFAL
jgi:hypothetical protein